MDIDWGDGTLLVIPEAAPDDAGEQAGASGTVSESFSVFARTAPAAPGTSLPNVLAPEVLAPDVHGPWSLRWGSG
jgi:hypothetical protein